MTLVVVLNAVLCAVVVIGICALLGWAILTSRGRKRPVTVMAHPQVWAPAPRPRLPGRPHPDHRWRPGAGPSGRPAGAARS